MRWACRALLRVRLDRFVVRAAAVLLCLRRIRMDSSWPAFGMFLHFAALGVLALAIAVGCWTRTSTAPSHSASRGITDRQDELPEPLLLGERAGGAHVCCRSGSAGSGGCPARSRARRRPGAGLDGVGAAGAARTRLLLRRHRQAERRLVAPCAAAPHLARDARRPAAARTVAGTPMGRVRVQLGRSRVRPRDRPFLLWRRTRLVAYGPSWPSSTGSRACSFRSASSRG
jgi:hypothetical protein